MESFFSEHIVIGGNGEANTDGIKTNPHPLCYCFADCLWRILYLLASREGKKKRMIQFQIMKRLFLAQVANSYTEIKMASSDVV